MTLAKLVRGGIFQAVAVLLAGCTEEQPPEPCGPPLQFSMEDWEVPGQRLRCDHFAHLCGLPVESTIHEPDLQKAIDVVFLGDGYTLDELGTYRAKVAALIAGLEADTSGAVAMRPALFNYHRVDVNSPSSRVTNADRRDTALGSCYQDNPQANPRLQPQTERFLVELAAGNAPDVDVIVVVLRSDVEAANASPQYGSAAPRSTVHIPDVYPAEVLTHELGHAVFGLGDEYATVEDCYPRPIFSLGDPLFEANLSLDPAGGKWRGLVDGALPGGSTYSDCIYHPTDHCRMNADSDTLPFCPVCTAHIQTMFRVREEATFNDGPPRCTLTLDQLPEHVVGRLQIVSIGVDPNGLAAVDLTLDGDAVARPAGLSSPFECAFDGEWACQVHRFVDTQALANGTHQLEQHCVDTLGLESRQGMAIQVQN